MRKLASVQKIVNIEPIPGADNIELATVLGWKTIIKKGDFQIGDLCVYCEVDSILPEDNPSFEFLRQRCYNAKWRGYRIRTMKLRGQISQGIVFPMSILPPQKRYKEDDDVTEVLKIVKYDPEALEESKLLTTQRKRKQSKLLSFFLSFKFCRQIYRLFTKGRKRSHNFPTFIPQTDETRLQTIWERFINFSPGKLFYITEKLNGQSATYFLIKKKFKSQFGVCSRKIWLHVPDTSNYWKIARKYDIDKKMRANRLYDIAIQGEIVGPNIQGNDYKLSDLDFYVFNVYDIHAGRYLPLDKAMEIANILELKFVPIIEKNKTFDSSNTNSIYDFFNYIGQHQQSALNPNTIIEGIVIRTNDKSFSAKVINPQHEIQAK